MDYFDYLVEELCEKHPPKELARLYLQEKEVYASLLEDFYVLRKENDTLKYLIAKYHIERGSECLK